jgi:hypothetical protein
MAIKQIRTRDDLVALKNELGLRPDWHEPDERGVTADVDGASFDNAGFWGAVEAARLRAKYSDTPLLRAGTEQMIEMWVTLSCDGEPVAEVNLATLFAFATGWPGE